MSLCVHSSGVHGAPLYRGKYRVLYVVIITGNQKSLVFLDIADVLCSQYEMVEMNNTPRHLKYQL